MLISLSASAIGCSIPYSPVILGPLRSWVLAMSFLSSRVRNAVARVVVSTRSMVVEVVSRGVIGEGVIVWVGGGSGGSGSIV